MVVVVVVVVSARAHEHRVYDAFVSRYAKHHLYVRDVAWQGCDGPMTRSRRRWRMQHVKANAHTNILVHGAHYSLIWLHISH